MNKNFPFKRYAIPAVILMLVTALILYPVPRVAVATEISLPAVPVVRLIETRTTLLAEPEIKVETRVRETVKIPYQPETLNDNTVTYYFQQPAQPVNMVLITEPAALIETGNQTNHLITNDLTQGKMHLGYHP